MKRILGLAVGLLIFCTSSHAFRQEALNVISEKMNKDVPVTVITPDGESNPHTDLSRSKSSL